MSDPDNRSSSFWTAARQRKLALVGAISVLVVGVIAWRMSPDYQVSQAQQALARRDHGTALQWLERALGRDPHRAETHFWLARTHRREGRYEEMRKHL
jgi:cytochrome c-type biogenesis protein CcmH/NrfG